MANFKIAVLPGDGIGPEIIEQGKEYEMTEELATIFGNAGEIGKC